MSPEQPTRSSGAGSTSAGLRICCLLLVSGVVTAWVCKVVIPETRQFKFDFAPYYAAWYAAYSGHLFYEVQTGEQGLHGDIFSDFKGEMGIEEDFSAYIYPPQFAWMGSWVSRIPFSTCQVLWVWLNAALWIGCVVMLLGRSIWEQPLLASIMIILSLVYPAAAYSISLGQINILLFAMLVGCWWLVRRERPIPAGVLIGIAVLVKPHLGLFWIYFCWTRRWRAAVSCIVTIVVLTAASMVSLGIEPYWTYLHDVLPRISNGQAYIANQSAYAVLARVFVSDPAYLFADRLMEPHGLLDVLSLIVSLAIVAATFWVIPRRRGRAGAVSLEFAVVMCALLMANKIATIHHFTWVWLAISVFVTQTVRGGGARNSKILAVFVVGVALHFLTWKFFPWFNHQSGLLRLLACNTFVATVLIWVCNLRVLRRGMMDDSNSRR